MSATRIWLVTATVVATACGAWALHGVDEGRIGTTGLLGVYPVGAWLALAAVLAVLGRALGSHSEDRVVLGCALVGLAILLHAAPALIESAPRFPTAWVHAALADHVTATGDLPSDVDARFAWPGFFTAAGALTGLVGSSSATVWLGFAPTAVVLAQLPLLVALGRATLTRWQAAWAGAGVFLVADWVGQDYFAPQALALLMYLATAVLVLTHLRSTPASARPVARALDRWAGRAGGLRARVGRALAPQGDPPQSVAPTSTRVGLVLVVGLGSVAVASSHQLTPLILVAVLGVLGLTGRLRPWPLFLAAGVATATWLSIVGEPYWRGHFSDIVGLLGRVEQVLGNGVQERVVGSGAHLLVVRTRIWFAVAVWALAGTAVVRGIVRGRCSLPLLVLAGTPGLMVVAGSYGGEGFLRLFLFSLVGVAPLIGSLAFPDPRPDRPATVRPAVAAVGLVVAALVAVPAFLLARYGNESFERISADEVAAAEALSRVAPPGSRVVPLAQGGPVAALVRFTHDLGQPLMDTVDVRTAAEADIERTLGDSPRGVFLVGLRSQVEYGVQNADLPADWDRRIVADLLGSGHFAQVYANPQAIILQKVGG